MKRTDRLGVHAALFSLVMAVGLAGTPAVHAAPLELYGRLPDLEDLALSPDGSKIAYVKTAGNVRGIAIVSLADNKLLDGIKVGEDKLRGIQWADEDHILLYTSTTGPARIGAVTASNRTEFMGMQVYDLRTKKTTLLPMPLKDIPMVLSMVTRPATITHSQDDTILFVYGVHFVNFRSAPSLFRVDLKNHSERITLDGDEFTRGWIINGDGEVLASESYIDKDKRWAINVARDGRMVEIASGTADIEIPAMLGLGPEGNSVLISSIEGGDPVWRFLSLKDGKMSEPLAQQATLREPIEDPRTHRMIGGFGLNGIHFFDPTRQAQWDAVAKAFPDDQIDLASWTEDFNKVVLRLYGRKHGLLYVLIDLKSGKLTPLGEVYAGLGKPLEVRRIVYAASDGLRIPALLTLPEGKAPAKLPLVVLPHGGPAERDVPDFDWLSEAIATQGYAVLRPNFRGSTVNWSFQSAGFGQWGRKMQSDLSDGVRELAKQGIIDPARVCIMGGSYGGYAALAGVTLESGVYRCAVSIAGPSDLQAFLTWQKNTKGASRERQAYWDRYMGSTGPDDPVLATLSPLKHIDAVKVPILLIHGKDDIVVPFEQSRIMEDALRKANKPVELVTLQHEDHWLSRSETRLQMLQEAVKFLKANNPP